MSDPTELLQGTLDMLILKALSLGPLHGYGVLLRIQQISQDRLQIQQGSVFDLYRTATVGRARACGSISTGPTVLAPRPQQM